MKKPQKTEINKIVLFYNNLRGDELRIKLEKNFQIYSIVTKKNLNYAILKKKNKDLKVISSLNNEFLFKFLKKFNADLFIAAGFPHIFKKNFFNLSKNGIINLHAGRLPKYRGGSPLNWQIINNEKKIGISIIKLNQGIDEGDIICSSEFKNDKKYTIKDVHKKVNRLFISMTFKAIKMIINNKKFIKQPKCISYFHQRSDKDGIINWNQSAKTLYNFVRAISYPYKGAFFFNKKKKYRIFKSREVKINPKFLPGTIFRKKNKDKFFVKCKYNSLELINSNIDPNKIKYEII